MELKNKKEILESIEKLNNNIEFEVRYGSFMVNNNKTYYKPVVSLEHFSNICNYMNTNVNSKFEKIEYSLIVNHKDGTRVTQILDCPYNNEVLSYPWKKNKIIGEKIIKKKLIKNIDELLLGIRFSLSEENLITDTSKLYLPENPAIFYKVRKRITYIWENVKIDISIYKSTDNLNNLENQSYNYDVELEVLNNKITFEELKIKVEAILKIVQNTFIVMNNTEIKNVRKEYFSLIKNKKFIGCQPESLKLSKILKDEDYTMTLKLDGKRYLLFIYDSKCYLIDNKLDICKIDLKIKEECNFTLIDGELVDDKYYCFDILYMKNLDIRNLNFNKRYEKLIEVVNIVDSGKNSIILKDYIYKDIYMNMLKYIDNNNKLTDSSIDGFILVPVNKEYPTSKNKNVPLKWKPENLNTIDFKIKKIKKDKDFEEWLLLCSGDNEDIPFFYMDNNDLSRVKIANDIATNYMDDIIIEFHYDKITEQFYPCKPRHDKTKGNYIKVAQDNFDTIMQPFKLEILQSLENKSENQIVDRKNSIFFNMRRFHNWIKRYLLEKYSNKCINLLDLACGKGGDIHKWVDNNIRHVEGYDIDNKSIEQAKNRYNKVISKPTSKNFEYKFEVKDLSSEIINKANKFDLVTCFFAIHYFYKNKNTLENFIENLKNIKENSHVIITTLCSEKLKNIDYEYNSENLKINKINIDNDKKIGNSIKVFIKDTVLNEEREEYIVDYEYTINLMKNKGFELVESELFSEYYPKWKENQNFLSYKERQYSFLNRTYVFIKKFKFNIDAVTFTNSDIDNIDLNNQLLNRPIKEKNTWTLKELKEYCKQNGMDTKGKKEQLIERIKNKE